MKHNSIARHILVLSALLIAVCLDAPAAVKPDVFSSPSTLRRVTEMEKSKEFKAFEKQIKKRYRNIKDIAVEEWKDGVTYYVLYCKKDNNTEFGLMRLTDSIPMFGSARGLYSFPALELSTIDGYTFFKASDTDCRFHNGAWDSFNPSKDLSTFGDRRYVCLTWGDQYKIFSFDGTPLLMNESFEFRDATPAGFTHDAATGLSIYHPALPPRFFGQTKTEYLRAYGEPIAYNLGDSESPNSTFNIKVPGGEYYIKRMSDVKTAVKTEVRTDPNGKLHEYKVFEVGDGDAYNNFGWQTSLCRHGGTTGEPVISGKLCQLKISTPDQIVYYTAYDSENFMVRTGCVSLVDSTFKVVPRFADVKVFYDNAKKPYALVKMSSLGEYEIYDPAKTYDYSSMSPLETAYERQDWFKVISQIKPAKIGDFQEKNLMIWFTAETEKLKSSIDFKEQQLQRIVTGNLFASEKEELEKEAAGGRSSRMRDWPSFNDYNIENAFIFFAGKYDADPDKAENYTALAKYVKEMRARDAKLKEDINTAKDNYIDGLKESARQKQVLDAMEARQANEGRQQEIMLHVLGAISGVVNQIFTPSVQTRATISQTTSGLQPVSPYGPTMLDRTSIAPEVTGLAISAGWVPDYSDSGSTSVSSSSSSTSSSQSSSSRICHACYGSGKCPHCHGKGIYAPNLNGNMIDCTSCNKSGKCHVCNGSGHH